MCAARTRAMCSAGFAARMGLPGLSDEAAERPQMLDQGGCKADYLSQQLNIEHRRTIMNYL